MPGTFPISPKQDDPQRIIELNGVDKKFYLSAEEINLIINMLAQLLGNETSLYKGEYDYLQEIEAEHPNPEPGSYAQIRVVDGTNQRASWDNTNMKWFVDGDFVEPGSDAAYLLKSIYDADGDGILDKAKDIHAVLTAGGTKYYGTKNGVVGVFDFPEGTGTGSPSPTQSPTELISFTLGWQSGLTFQPNASWKEDGITKSDTREITLAAADATYDRFDLLAVDLTSGAIIAISGAPSENPAYPEIDPLTQLAGPFISVKAGSAAPEGIAGSPIYAENLGAPDEWNIGAVGSSFNTASTNSPYAGTKCIEVVTPLNYNQSLSFLPENPVPVSQAKEMTFRIKNIAGGAFSILIIAQRTNGTTANFWRDAPVNYDPANTADYQFCSVVLPSNSNLATISRIALVAKVEGLSYFLDEVRLVSGIDPMTSNYATEEFVLDNIETAKQEAIAESKAYADSLVIGGGDNVHDSYDTMALMIADQGNQIDGEYFVVVDASAHSTVDAGWAFFEYLGTTLGTEDDYRKLSEEESMDVSSDGGGSGTSEARQAFTAYLDIINGDDSTAELTNPSKPFKTAAAIFVQLDTTGNYKNYWKIIIQGGGTVPMPQTVPRNIIWEATKSAALDYTDMGQLRAFASSVEAGNYSWVFNNGNISIVCNYIDGPRTFSQTLSRNDIAIRGHVNEVSWQSSNDTSSRGPVISEYTAFKGEYVRINKVTSYATASGCSLEIYEPTTPDNVTIEIGTFSSSAGMASVTGFTSVPSLTIIILNLDVTGGFTPNKAGTGGTIKINKIVSLGAELKCSNVTRIIFNNCTYPDNANIRFYGTVQVEGELIGNTPIGGQYMYDVYFKNFTGYLSYLTQYSNTASGWTFENCYIRIVSSISRWERQHANIGTFKGHNTFISDVPGSELVVIGGGSATAKLNKYGTIKTNCVISASGFTNHTPNTF